MYCHFNINKILHFAHAIYLCFHMIFRINWYYFLKKHKKNIILVDKKFVFCETGTGLLSII
jgi:hypothetical protein